MTTGDLGQSVPRLERDGGRMPVLGLGTFQCTGESCRAAVRAALGMGYRHLDTAQMYGNEHDVGQGMRDAGLPREEVFVTTKLQPGQLRADRVRASCEGSLGLLGTDYVDLLLIHWPDPDVPLAETLGAMAELRREGLIRHLGISNFPIDLVQRAVAATDAPILCNQVEYHPYLGQDALMHCCREHDIVFVAYSPLARGRVHDDTVLQQIGEKYDKTPAQVALRWVLSRPGLVTIPKASSEAHIRQNFEVFDFDLDEDDLAQIRTLDSGQRLIDPPWSPAWDT